MADLHSVILPVLERADCRQIIEIGSEAGGMTRLLIEHAKQHQGQLTSIDPRPDDSAAALLSSGPYGVLDRDISLRAIPRTAPADAYLVDGDHNYYTVTHELLLIERMMAWAKKPLLVFLHDVGWPWGNRDLYYHPDGIPKSWLHPHSWDKGVTLDQPSVIEGGFRGCGAWAPALVEGGPRNGVLKAVEDFHGLRAGAIEFALIPAVFGLGVLYAKQAPWADAVREFLAPYDRNPLLAKLERNRLENYLRVIALQDAASREIAPALAVSN
jgi:hypothetical protein